MVCCQHVLRMGFSSLATPWLVGKERKKAARRMRLTCTTTWPRPRPSTSTALTSLAQPGIAVAVMGASRGE